MKQSEIKPFKDMNIIKIYNYYDMPMCYSFKDENGQLYLADFVDYEEKDNIDVWVYLPLTADKLKAYNENKISLRQIFRDLADEKAIIDKENSTGSFLTTKTVKDLNQDYLPDEDSYLSK